MRHEDNREIVNRILRRCSTLIKSRKAQVKYNKTYTQTEERKLYINVLNNVSKRMEYMTSKGESQRSGSENKLGLMYELAMEQKLQSIVSSDFPHLVLHEVQTRRLYPFEP